MSSQYELRLIVVLIRQRPEFKSLVSQLLSLPSSFIKSCLKKKREMAEL